MTTFGYDEIVLQFRAQGIPLSAAKRAALRELGLCGNLIGAIEAASREPMRCNRPSGHTGICGCITMHEGQSVGVEQPGADALEDVHVEEADKLVRALGGHVVRNSQKRASKVTPGIPDRMYFFPRHRVFAFWEAKKDGGRQSTAQRYFQELCDACSVKYVLGPLSALEGFIVNAGIALRLEDGTYVIHQPDPAGTG